MENRPVISIVSRYFLPGQEGKHNEYYEKWFFEAYVPFLSESAGLRAAERYRIVKENPDYPKYMQIWYFNNLKEHQMFEKSEEFQAILSAMDANFPGTDFRWWVQYWVADSWQHGRLGQSLEAKDGAVIHMEASQGHLEEEKYFPMLINTEQARRIDRCRIVKENPKYPSFLSIFRFQTIEMFEDWEKRRKTATVKSDYADTSIKSPSWYIQYQLTRSWRK
jgi:hypothetical protein